jgi:hypothetical protein
VEGDAFSLLPDIHAYRQLGKMPIDMIKRERVEELLNLPVDERRRVLCLLQESLPENWGSSPTVRRAQ